jgi:hypothetical protein
MINVFETVYFDLVSRLSDPRSLASIGQLMSQANLVHVCPPNLPECIFKPSANSAVLMPEAVPSHSPDPVSCADSLVMIFCRYLIMLAADIFWLLTFGS